MGHRAHVQLGRHELRRLQSASAALLSGMSGQQIRLGFSMSGLARVFVARNSGLMGFQILLLYFEYDPGLARAFVAHSSKRRGFQKSCLNFKYD